VGDGWLVSSATPQEVRSGRDIVFSTAAELGRAIESDHVGVLLGCCVAASQGQALAKAQRFVTRPRPDAAFTEFSAVGTPDDIAGVIQDYIDAGASKFVLRPLCPGPETAEQLAVLGQEVLPRFHRSSAPPSGR
jgi:alkanesulfonate monooxygenase SsuD/methylene tetrahydromethanopterin reductase-like flavin-dependent oxidoreductase (luciferase family)